MCDGMKYLEGLGRQAGTLICHCAIRPNRAESAFVLRYLEALFFSIIPEVETGLCLGPFSVVMENGVCLNDLDEEKLI